MEVTLKNDRIGIAADTLGAELTSLKTADGLELLWQGDDNHWKSRSPILFPVVGGLPDDQYELEDKRYKMDLHGFARRSEFHLIEKAKESVAFQLRENKETLGQYPYHFVLDVSYTLKDNCLTVGFTIHNRNDRTMLFSIGAHPGFRCPLYEKETMEDYYLQFEKAETASRRFKENGLLTGEKEEILHKESKLRLAHDLFCRDAIILDHLHSDWVELRNDRNSQVIRVEFDGFPYLGIWSARNDGPFVCIEPWYGIDSTHGDSYDLTRKEGIQFLEPETMFQCEHRIIV